MIETQCRCGSVRLSIKGEPVVQLYCHCDDCQAAHSAAYVASAVFPAAAVEIAGGATQADAVRDTPRVRCAKCGQHLYSEIRRANMRSVNAYLFPKGAFRPQFHVQCQYAVLPIADALPHYKAFPPAFGGTEALVDW